MDQKRPNSDFQSQNSMSNIDSIHLKTILYLEYWNSRTIFIIAIIWLIHFWKTFFSKKGPYFCHIMRNPKQVQWKILFVDINFLSKSEHSLGWALLCSIGVVILSWWYMVANIMKEDVMISLLSILCDLHSNIYVIVPIMDCGPTV